MFSLSRWGNLVSRRCFSTHNAGLETSSCDVAIIGGGIMGLNVAYQLARRDPNINVKLFEKAPGSGYGSSGASSAILRTFYTFPEMIEFSRDGIELYKNWHNYLQMDMNDENIVSKFTKTGLLFFMPMPETEALKTKEKYDKLGLEYTLIDDQLLQEKFPTVNNDITNLVDNDYDNDNDSNFEEKETLTQLSNKKGEKHVMLYEEEAGYFDPTGALTDLQYSIKQHYPNQIDLYFNSKVSKLNYQSGKVTGINVIDKNNKEYSVNAPIVINCNGPWYQELIAREKELNGFDIELTLKAVRIQVIYKDLPQLYTNEILSKCLNNVPIPVISDPLCGTYMRPQVHSKQILVSCAREEDERDYIENADKCTPDLGCESDYRNIYLNSLYHRLSPVLDANMAGASKVNGMTGMYTVTEDDVHPIIGQTKLNGFYVCNGFSGHGFKCAPAVGAILAKNITNIELPDDTKVDISFYSPYRKPHQLRVKSVFA